MTTPTHSHMAWTDKGGHVTRPAAAPMLLITAMVFAASQSFRSPIGYQTNLMVFGRSRSSKPSLCRRWCCGWGNFHVESNGFV